MRPSQIYDGTPIASRRPWFSFPMVRVMEVVDLLLISIRSLPDDQLAAETALLETLCAGTNHLGHRLMLRAYQDDAARRADPLRRFDADLDAALARLVRNTNEPDRQLVREIGQKLFDVGGTKAMQDAQQRALAAVEPEQQALRQRFIEKRWAGIGA